MDLIGLLNQTSLIQQWHQGIKNNYQKQLLTGLSGSAKTLAIVGTYQKLQQPIIVVTANLYYANQLAEDLKNLEGEDN